MFYSQLLPIVFHYPFYISSNNLFITNRVKLADPFESLTSAFKKKKKFKWKKFLCKIKAHLVFQITAI